MHPRPSPGDKGTPHPTPRSTANAAPPEQAWSEPRSRARRVPQLSTNAYQTPRPVDTHSNSEQIPEVYQEAVTPYVPAHVQHPGESHREMMAGSHYDRRYSYSQNGHGNGRHVDYANGGGRMEYVDMRVFALPYGYTANNQPLYIQYGSVAGDIAAQAVIGLGQGYNYAGYDGGDGGGYYEYGHGTGEAYHRYGMRGGGHVGENGGGGYAAGGGHGEVDGRAGGQRRVGEEDRMEERGEGQSNGSNGVGLEEQGAGKGEGEREKGIDMRDREVEEMDAACTLEGLRGGSKVMSGEENEVGEDGKVRVSQKASGRITWNAELHEEFLKALDELGMEQAVPMSILNKMRVKGLTREQVASHLQKHRTMLKKEREEKEREMLLNVAARSVMQREENIGKDGLTEEEVLDAVVKEERVKGGAVSLEEYDGVASVGGRKKVGGGVRVGLGKIGRAKKSGDSMKVKEGVGKSKRLRRGLSRQNNA